MADRFANDRCLASTQKYLKIAADAGLDPVTMATAWSKQFSFVASTIIGATTPEQLDASLAAMDLELSDEVLRACDEVHKEILYPMG
jgi:aryl-alcohol dehydrogenase-like predicted oxidoreductase